MLNRRDQVILSRIVIGQTKVTHKFLLAKEDQPLCKRCKTSLSIDHLILQCEVYLLQRTQLSIKPTLKENLKDRETISRLLQYLKHTMLYDII
ncbi:hypothetical protein WN48_09512 [Eufriesea mexicana]|nr:hypothetical protein WN48_09512 [Eufriesea mexicana]